MESNTSTVLQALPDDVPTLFDSTSSRILYPALLGQVRVIYEDKKTGARTTERSVYTIPLKDALIPVEWDKTTRVEKDLEDYAQQAPNMVDLHVLPQAAHNRTSYTAWRKELTDWVYQNEGLQIWRHPGSGSLSQPGEDKALFANRLQDLLHSERDEAVTRIREQHQKQVTQLERRIETAEQALDREESQAKEAKRQTAISFGGALLSMLMSKKKSTVGNVGRATSAVRGVSRSKRQEDDVKRQETKLNELQAEIDALENELQGAIDGLTERYTVETNTLQEKMLKPLKKNITIELLAVLWQ